MSAVGELDPLQLSKLKVADLKRELKSRGLSYVGNKNELLERLQEAIHITDEALEAGDVDDENAEDIFLEDDVLADDRPEDDNTLHDEVLSTTMKTDESGISLLASPEAKIVTLDTSIIETEIKEAGEKDENLLSPKRVQDLSMQEKLELRSKRFNLPMTEENSATDSLVKRAQRFGMPLPKVAQQKIDNVKLQQRAERFGVQAPLDDKTRLLKRKEKFGTVANDLELDEKKRKRAERFGLKTL